MHEFESIADDLRGIPDENQLSGRQRLLVAGDRQPVDMSKVQDRTRQLGAVRGADADVVRDPDIFRATSIDPRVNSEHRAIETRGGTSDLVP